MYRVILFSSIAGILVMIYLMVADKKMTIKRRLQFIAAILGFLLLGGLSLMFQSAKQEAAIRDALITSGFSQISENEFRTLIDGQPIFLDYDPEYRGTGRTDQRFEITIDFGTNLPELRHYFCEQREYDAFISHHFGGLYPTPERKLSNDHFVGKCYPQSAVERVSKLERRRHDFEPLGARYLFLPQPDDANVHKIVIQTENLDVETLQSRIQEFIEYYRAVMLINSST